MKLWIYKTPYDYHKQSEIVVMAESAEEAVVAMKRYLHNKIDAGKYISSYGQEQFISSATPADMREHESAIYFNEGCDC